MLGFEPTTEQDSGQPGAGKTFKLAEVWVKAFVTEKRERKLKERKGMKSPRAVFIVKE